jgi:hypothetical protein
MHAHIKCMNQMCLNAYVPLLCVCVLNTLEKLLLLEENYIIYHANFKAARAVVSQLFRLDPSDESALWRNLADFMCVSLLFLSHSSASALFV